jgi:mycoredoxin
LTDPVNGSPETPGANQRVTLYWRPGCVFCLRMRFFLWRHRLSVQRINIWADPDAAAFVRSVANGNETVPTVVINGHPIVNPAPSQVVAALRSP